MIDEQNFVQQASRAQILDKATEYIQYMRRKNHTHQQDIDDLKKQNALLEQQGHSWHICIDVCKYTVFTNSYLFSFYSSCTREGQGKQPGHE